MTGNAADNQNKNRRWEVQLTRTATGGAMDSSDNFGNENQIRTRTSKPNCMSIA
jgi:hypothetical protein